MLDVEKVIETHKISFEVDQDLFDFHQSLLPWGERGILYVRILQDMRVIHKANPTIVRSYLLGNINLLQFKEELKRKKK